MTKIYEYYIYPIDTRIYNIDINNFLKVEPPCKECLVQVTCIRPSLHYNNINTRRCDLLIEFLTETELFKLRVHSPSIN